ncbi:hypothetical protein [Azoarcus olearius]|uniref:hypothetical protein n=1 Tax=Azoarcus sp. (strain BH72) TaxID=418699 RepID=UPI0011D2A3FC|nr:hypothetical protein [Azoarcus olearius]
MGQIEVGHVFLLRLVPRAAPDVLQRKRIGTGIYVVITTLGMNISAVNGKDEISWMTKNTMKNQTGSLFIVVRTCTIQVPEKSLSA